MAKTPEGEIKKMIIKRLTARGLVPAKDASKATAEHTGKFIMPVPNFRGVMGIPDIYGHYRSRYFEIEAKRLGEEPTPLQRHQLSATRVTGAAAFAVDSERAMNVVEAWMDLVDEDEDSEQ